MSVLVTAAICLAIGYLAAVTRRTWRDWASAAKATEILRVKRWEDLKALLTVSGIALLVLYMATTTKR
jgi:hypothetical protein